MTAQCVSRRGFLGGLAAGCVARAQAEKLPPIRPLTRGPAAHWFGYYDKLQFDPSGRYALGMEVAFEHRTPRPADRIKLGMIDLQAGDRWIDLGETTAWCWQQGCMLQWLPGSKTEVIWNGREGGRYVSHILDVKTRKRRTLPAPIYAVSPDATWAVAPDFRRLADTRPGYGYNGIPDPNRDVPAPGDAGIWRLDLRSGKNELLISFADVARISCPRHSFAGAKHWFNHLLVAPDGKRFIFLHRWALPGKTWTTRMLTANANGTDLHVVDDFGGISHFIWRDPSHILSWASRPEHGRKFYLYEDRTDRVEVVGPDQMTSDGHCTYLPGHRWILCDTYPDKSRYQHPYLFDTKTGIRHPLGHFLLPEQYAGEWRCDLHPRISPDGRRVTIDSPHAGNGRQIYLIDVGAVLES